MADIEYPALTEPELVKLNGCITELIQSKERQAHEKSFQKDVAERVKDEFNISPAKLNKLVSQRLEEKSTTEIHKHEVVQDFDEEIRTAVRNAKKKNGTVKSED